MRIGSVCRYKCLCLGRDRSEHALLVETDTVAAAPILRTFKSRASNLSESENDCQQGPDKWEPNVPANTPRAMNAPCVCGSNDRL